MNIEYQLLKISSIYNLSLYILLTYTYSKRILISTIQEMYYESDLTRHFLLPETYSINGNDFTSLEIL